MVHEACEKSARSSLSGEAMPLNSSIETTPPAVLDVEDGEEIVTEEVKLSPGPQESQSMSPSPSENRDPLKR